MDKGTLIFNSTELRNIASAMDVTVADFNKNIKRIDDVCAKLKSAWTGAEADKYYSTLVEKANLYQELDFVLSELPGQLRYVANLLDEGKANL